MAASSGTVAPRPTVWKVAVRSFPVYVAAAGIAAALLIPGRTGGSGSLTWMLAPTAACAGLFSGIPFAPDPRGGYVNPGHGIAIGRGCAGIRFFTIAFLLGILSTVHRLDASWKRWACLAGTLGGAYLVAVLANASRIAGAILLLGISGGWSGPVKTGLHLMEGIAVFASYLALFSFLVRSAMKRSGS